MKNPIITKMAITMKIPNPIPASKISPITVQEFSRVVSIKVTAIVVRLTFIIVSFFELKNNTNPSV